MTYTLLSGSYPSGYAIAAGVTSLKVDPAAMVGSTSWDGYGLEGQTVSSPSITITNTGGTIAGKYGVHLDQPAILTNESGLVKMLHGGSSTVAGEIYGQQSGITLEGFYSTLSNYGLVEGGQLGVFASSHALIVNGSASYRSAQILDTTGYAVEMNDEGALRNFATIDASAGEGVRLMSGYVLNGSASDTAAEVIGGRYAGVRLEGSSANTVTNFGTIQGGGAITDPSFAFSYSGVEIDLGGSAANGSGTDTRALIEGAYGVFTRNMAATLTNDGTIAGSVKYGVVIAAGGSLENGTASDHAATIKGADGGARLVGGASGGNQGLIEGMAGVGLYLASGSFTNGASGDAGAIIEGETGVEIGADATLTNFGTIEGAGAHPGAALYASTARLNLEASAVIVGAIDAGAGTVDIVGGVASATGLATHGRVIGAGTLSLTGGNSVLESGTALSVAKVAVGATATVEVQGALGDAKLWRQSGGTLEVDAGERIAFSGAGNSFAGILSGTGTIEFTAGSDTWSDLTLSVSRLAISKAVVSLEGTINLATTLTTPELRVATAATLKGGGTITLASAATSEIFGASATTLLTNFDTIRGAGKLGAGKLELTNQAGGVIDADTTVALTIDTGSQTVTNAGIIESTSTGGLSITSAVANTGTIQATKGEVTLDGALTGSGLVRIVGGTIDLAGAFSGKVAFGVAGGTLALAHSATDTVTVSGFSKTGTSKLDLADIAFTKAKVSYTGTTKSGTLTVTDGTHSAAITLTGNYTASTFTLASDGHGGTLVDDPSAHAPAARFVAASAAVGAGHGPPLIPAHSPPTVLLAAGT